MHRRYAASTIFILPLFMFFSSITTVEAGFLDEAKKVLNKVGDVLEEARDDVKEEANRNFRRMKRLAKEAQEETQKIERRIRKIRDELKDEIAKLPIVGEKINNTIDIVEKTIENTSQNIGQNLKKIEKLDSIVQGNLDPVTMTLKASASILGAKIAEEIRADEINGFLDSEIFDELRIIDILLPIQGGLERLDPTGTQECLREETVVRTTAEGDKILTGAPSILMKGLSSTALLQKAAIEVVGNCLERNTKSSEQHIGISAEEIALAKSERDQAIEDVKQNEEKLNRQKEYSAALKFEVERQEKILSISQKLADRAKKIQEDNQKLAIDLEKLLEEEAPNIDLTQYQITD